MPDITGGEDARCRGSHQFISSNETRFIKRYQLGEELAIELEPHGNEYSAYLVFFGFLSDLGLFQHGCNHGYHSSNSLLSALSLAATLQYREYKRKVGMFIPKPSSSRNKFSRVSDHQIELGCLLKTTMAARQPVDKSCLQH